MAAQLESWDFANDALNGTTSLINRQKSAANLVVTALDRNACTGSFFDPERKVNSQATLQSCDCHDFSFVGRTPRKKFQPCMHIYRLAIELGRLDPHYRDYAARDALQRGDIGQLKQSEDERLRGLGRDPQAWGRWPAIVHQAGLQRNRQYRAYFLVDDEQASIRQVGSGWQVRDYRTALDDCSCPDFEERQLPCKHVYTIAVLQGLAIALSRGEYEAARRLGQEIVFGFPVERPDPLDRF
jgi:hypothetical protein